MKRALAILTSTILYGKERSNIEVYNLLKEKCQLSVIINRKASAKLKTAVSNMKTHAILAPNRHAPKLRLLTFLITYVIGNLQTLYYLIRLRPNLLVMCSEITFYDLYPALFFYKGRIVYRIGDEPAYKSLSFREYNKHVWKQYVLKKVDVCVCISRYIMNTLKATGRNTKNDKIIYNYPPTRKISNHDEQSLYRVSGNTSSLVFGYIGQIFEQKGVHHLVECAIKILDTYPETLFYIAGSLSYRPEYSQMIIDMIPDKKKKNIIFLDEIENVEMFFRQIDVLCVPSIKQEPLGNVLVEAKKYSRPCIIYPTGGMPELITHKKDGYVCKAPSPDSLLDGIKYYIFDKPLAREQGLSAHESIKELGIDRECFENKWNDVFDKMLG
jgi:glycosyltransferase involved in cell wall biosynthesis